MSPFILASCDCIVLPLDRPSHLPDHVECVCLKACDYDPESSEWGFNIRPFERVKLDTTIAPRENFRPARRLTDEETNAVVDAIRSLVSIGDTARNLTRDLDFISRYRQLPQAPTNRSSSGG